LPISAIHQVYEFIYLFIENYAIGGILTGVILLCHIELSKYNNARRTVKTKQKHKNEYTVSLESNTAFQKLINSINTASETEVDGSGTPYRYNCIRAV